jgi:predicted acetyltransferase
MLRIVDLAQALTARGYPEHVATDLELDLVDEVLEENAGRWSIHIANGRAAIERGGRGSIRLDVRGLAALYTGWMEPHALVVAGSLHASEADLSRLGAAFGGPSPSMLDFF